MQRTGVDRYDTPEHRLLSALLLDGILQLQRGANDPRAVEVARWVRGEFDGAAPPCPFTVVCAAFDLDPSDVARRLLSPRAAVKVPRRQVRMAYPRRKRGPYGSRRRLSDADTRHGAMRS